MTATASNIASKVRRPVSKKLRFEIFKRDGFRCVYCGATPSETVLLECDHIQPVADGGLTEIDNLVTSCRNCNRGKGAVALSVIPQSLKQKSSEVAEREEQIRAYYKILEGARQRRDDEMWSIAEVFMGRFKKDSILRSHLASIRGFLNFLDFPEILEAMEIACNKQRFDHDVFRYFCGICWKKIKRARGEDV